MEKYFKLRLTYLESTITFAWNEPKWFSIGKKKRLKLEPFSGINKITKLQKESIYTVFWQKTEQNW